MIEPLQLDCIPIHGPFMDKTREISRIFHENAISFEIRDASYLAQAVQSIFANPELYQRMVKTGHYVITKQTQVIDRILEELLPWLKHEHI